jgi:hypothetical protein
MLRSRKHCHGTHHGHELHQALQDSLSWLAIATGITLVCFTAAATLAVRYTRWGRQFWQLAGPTSAFNAAGGRCWHLPCCWC